MARRGAAEVPPVIVNTTKPVILEKPEDWLSWKNDVKQGIRNLKGKACLTSLPSDEAQLNEDLPEAEKDFAVYQRIWQSLARPVKDQVCNTKYAKQIWDLLHQLYEDTGIHRRISLVHELFGLKQETQPRWR